MSRSFAFVMVLLFCAAEAGATERVDDTLARHQTQGYASPSVAIRELQAAIDVPGLDAPVELRRRHAAAIASHACVYRRADMAATCDTALTDIRTLAAQGCQPCKAEGLLLEMQRAVAWRENEKAQALMAQAEPLLLPGDKALMHRWHYARARLFNLQGMFTKGIEAGVNAAELAQQMGNITDKTEALNALIALNAFLGHFRQAENYAQQAEALARPRNFNFALARVRLNQSLLYLRSKQHELQRKALEEAIALTGDDPDMEEIRAVSLSNLSDYWLSQQRWPEALEAAQKSEVLARRNNDARSLSYGLANGGVALAHLGQVEKGIAQIKEALALSETIGARNDQAGITQELIGVYERAGRYREALDGVRRVAAINAELTQQARNRAVLDLQEKYDAESRQRQIESLAAANRIKEAELAARAWRQRLWAALALALALAASLLVVLIRRAARDNRQLSGDVQTLAHESAHDPLTGIFNRRHCHALMAQHSESLRHAPAGTELRVALMLLDVDFFKQINDTWGHGAGDKVLVEIAQRLRMLVRQQDAVVRWGGEEFVLLLPGTGADGVPKLASRVLEAISGTPIDIGSQKITVRVSLGGVAWPLAHGADWDTMLKVADLALYLSKSSGRNRGTCVFKVGAHADLDVVCSDLWAARDSGQVELKIVTGPEPVHAPAIA